MEMPLDVRMLLVIIKRLISNLQAAGFLVCFSFAFFLREVVRRLRLTAFAKRLLIVKRHADDVFLQAFDMGQDVIDFGVFDFFV